MDFIYKTTCDKCGKELEVLIPHYFVNDRIKCECSSIVNLEINHLYKDSELDIRECIKDENLSRHNVSL